MRKHVTTMASAAMCAIALLGLLTVTHAQSTPRDQLLLAVGQTDSTLSLIKVEGRTLTPLTVIPVGKGPRELCLSPDGNRAYVSNDPESTVTVIDLVAQKVVTTISLPAMKRPDGCAVSPDGKKLYVAGMESGNVAIVSAVTNQLQKMIDVGKEPRRFVFTPDGRQVYVTSEDAKTIRVMDVASDKIVDSFESGGQGPRILVPLPDQKTLLVANVDDDSASFIDIATKKINLTIGVGGSPQRLEISRDGAWAYVLSVIEQKVSVIDLKGQHVRAKKFVTVGRGPYGMAMSEDGSLLFVTSGGNNEIAAYDTSAINALPLNTALAQVPAVAKVTLRRPMGLAIRPSAR